MNLALLLRLAQQVSHREVTCGAALKEQAVLDGQQAPFEIVIGLANRTYAIQRVDAVQWRLLPVL